MKHTTVFINLNIWLELPQLTGYVTGKFALLYSS